LVRLSTNAILAEVVVRCLPNPVEAQDIWTTIWYEEAHNSTAIEGNTLVLKQVERLLADGVAVGDKELKDYMEVRGYANAAQWV
jgi:hypothetical protein